MAKPSKIETHKLQDFVAVAVAEGKSLREIAKLCSEKAKEPISPMAVDRYLKSLEQRDDTKEAEAPAQPVRPLAKKPAARAAQVEEIVASGIDIINLQYRTTSVLVDKFESIIDLPDAFERRMQSLEEEVRAGGADPTYLGEWSLALVNDIRRNVQNVTSINRELRENSKFIVDLREKAFNQNLAMEFVDRFMELFQRASPEAFDRVMAEVAANPRLQRLVEQQFRGVAG